MERSQQLAKEARQLARDAKFVMVPANNDMFSSLKMAGEGKASFTKSILSLFKMNAAYNQEHD